AGEVVFVKDCPEAFGQLLSFRSGGGRRDIPNALAYALRLRPGQPIYENFGVPNVDETLSQDEAVASYLACNSDGSCTTAILLQVSRGAMFILADWMREGGPDSALAGIVREAQVAGGSSLAAYAPPEHFRPLDSIGLCPAAAGIPMRLHRGGEP